MKKTCRKCKIEQDISCFRPSKYYGSGYLSQCRACVNNLAVSWSSRNRERKNENQRRFYALNKEKMNASATRWKRENPEKVRMGKKVATARRKSSRGKFTSKDVSRLYENQNGKCNYCKCELGKKFYHLDHIIPVSKGGINFPVNLQILCAPCNLKKKDADPIKYEQKIGFERTPTIDDQFISFMVNDGTETQWKRVSVNAKWEVF